MFTCNWISFPRPVNLPWLYYKDRTSQIFADAGITTRFTFPNSILSLKASTYSLDGQFLGYQSVLGGLLQLCKNSDSYMDAAYIFGTRYSQSVSNARDSWTFHAGLDAVRNILVAYIICTSVINS